MKPNDSLAVSLRLQTPFGRFTSACVSRLLSLLLFTLPTTLQADTAPEIIDPPLTQFAWSGQPVTFKVSYTNKTAMTFQWQWNETNLLAATKKTFALAHAELTNAGDYRVILSNSVGVVTSAVARLTVRDWPQPTGVSFTNLSRLETNLHNIMRTNAVPGVSLAVMKDGRLILARGFGYADPLHSAEQVQPDSLFGIASLSKAITATAVLKLVDEGRLNLDAKVFPLLNLPPPTFPGAKMDQRLTNITVRHLLNHTAGWSRETARSPLGQVGFDPFLWPQRCAADLGLTNPPTAYGLLEWVTGFPLQATPGTTFDYSNNGYIAAGILIEQITGRPYEQSIQALLAPADITRLHIFGRRRAERKPEEAVPTLSPLFDLRAFGPSAESPSTITAETAYYYPLDWLGGAGGWMTTPMDYARFIATIDGQPIPPDLLTSNAVKTMLTPSQPSINAGQPYGMGWDVNSSEISHNGVLYVGALTLAVRRPNGVVYAVFCNTSIDYSFLVALKTTLDSGVSAVKTWPTNDLFQATMSYEAWQARHFTPAELSEPDVSGDNADPDADGISNLVEYAQGFDPRSADHESWLQGRRIVAGDQVRFAIGYRARPLGHAVRYSVEVSSDLKRWDPFEGEATEQLEEDGMVRTTLTDTTSATERAPSARFFRVTVSLAHPQPQL
ncbi:MAG: beta-lactamase [Verrucomicrobiales bacterium]|nr:beta-lactamase [Verrucomicrobiales bacterium]